MGFVNYQFFYEFMKEKNKDIFVGMITLILRAVNNACLQDGHLGLLLFLTRKHL